MTTLPTEPTAALAGFAHVSVMGDEVIEALRPVPAGWVVDGTLGGGGHSERILHELPHLSVLGLDRDPAALQAATARLAPFGDRFAAEHSRFSELTQVCERRGLTGLSGVLADVGVSSHQIDTAERGFSFRQDGPLDMRMDPTRGETLEELLSEVTVEDLANVLYEYGDIRRSIGTARMVLEAFQQGARTTSALANRLAARLPRNRSIHPATMVFQALRIWVNAELDELQTLLETAPTLLQPGGRMAVIAFHSGEDRLVKQSFRERAPGRYGEYVRITRKPWIPKGREQDENPRSRSARLRVLERAVPGSQDRYGNFEGDDNDEGDEG